MLQCQQLLVKSRASFTQVTLDSACFDFSVLSSTPVAALHSSWAVFVRCCCGGLADAVVPSFSYSAQLCSLSPCLLACASFYSLFNSVHLHNCIERRMLPLPAALLFLSEACLVSLHSILYEQTLYTVMWMAVKLSSKNHSQSWPMVDD